MHNELQHWVDAIAIMLSIAAVTFAVGTVL